MCGVACARTLLIFFNLIFWLAGGGLLGIGIWMKIDDTIINYLKVVNIEASDSLIEHASTIFIVVGAFIFVVGFLGCCGALKKHPGMLFLYALLVFVAMAAEIAAAVLALIYRQKIENHLEESMMRQVSMKYYHPDQNDTTDAWNFLQTELSCCGVNGYKDYVNSFWWNYTRSQSDVPFVPDTCCVLKEKDVTNPEPMDRRKCWEAAQKEEADDEYINTEGCKKAVDSWFKQHSLILMAVGFGVGAIQIIGFVAACCLRSALRKTGKHEV